MVVWVFNFPFSTLDGDPGKGPVDDDLADIYQTQGNVLQSDWVVTCDHVGKSAVGCQQFCQ